jgi:hypothetical protein
VNGINQPQQGTQLFDAEGRRLYFTEEERRAFVAAAAEAPHEVRTFRGGLGVTDCQTSDALVLTAQQVDLPGRVIVPMRWRLQQGVRGEHPVVGLAELRQL